MDCSSPGLWSDAASRFSPSIFGERLAIHIADVVFRNQNELHTLSSSSLPHILVIQSEAQNQLYLDSIACLAATISSSLGMRTTSI